MAGFGPPEWAAMLVPDQSVLESFLRGTLVYFALIAVFRVVLNRQVGAIGVTDVMLTVLISEAVSNALNNQSKSITNGVVTVVALVFWNYVLDRAAYRWWWARRLLESPALPLVVDGQPIRENLRHERVSEDELMAHLRESGVDSLAKVKAMFMESAGQISVIKADDADGPKGRPAGSEPEDGTADGDGPPDFDAAARRFAEAARRLQAAVHWHETRAAEHRKAVQEGRAALAKYGVRVKLPAEHPDDGEPAPNGAGPDHPAAG